MNPDLPSAAPLAPCNVWCGPPDPNASSDDDGTWCCDADLSKPNVMAKAEYAALVASSVLFRLSGYRFNGVCQSDDYLCVRRAPCGCSMLGAGNDWRSFPVPTGDAETWLNVSCGCAQGCDCLGAGRTRIALPYGPVVEITAVSIDGEAVAVEDRKVIDGRWLYLRNVTSEMLVAACYDPFETPPGGFRVQYAHGQQPPPDGVMAACALACEIMKSCLDQECALPKRVTSLTRQGVTFALLDPMTFLDNGRTGIYEVDLFLAGYDTPQTTATWVESVDPIDFSERARARW